MNDPIVIAEAGHAGVRATAPLREEGYAGEILLIGDETSLPYQRRPLSKAFLKTDTAVPDLPLRGAAFYSDNDITLMLGEIVEAIDRSGGSVRLASVHLGGKHEDLAGIDAIRIADLVPVGLVDHRVTRALAVGFAADAPEAVAAGDHRGCDLGHHHGGG